MNRGKTWVQNTAATVRIIFGIMFLFSGVSYFFMPASMIIGDPNSPGGMFVIALLATGYFLPFLKVTEAIGGLLLLSKRFSAFALVLLAPVLINIFLYGLFLEHPVAIVGLILGLIEIFLAWYNWHKFAPLFKKA